MNILYCHRTRHLKGTSFMYLCHRKGRICLEINLTKKCKSYTQKITKHCWRKRPKYMEQHFTIMDWMTWHCELRNSLQLLQIQHGACWPVHRCLPTAWQAPAKRPKSLPMLKQSAGELPISPTRHQVAVSDRVLASPSKHRSSEKAMCLGPADLDEVLGKFRGKQRVLERVLWGNWIATLKNQPGPLRHTMCQNAN